jgi:TRAP-type mannitol/chloroaromatic compound transport system permease large subunit
LAYAFICVAIAGVFYVVSFSKTILPAAHLAQVPPSRFIDSVDDIYAKIGSSDGVERTWQEKEMILKSPSKNGVSRYLVRNLFPLLGFLIIVLGWIFFGLSIFWGLGSRGGTATD